MKNVKLEGGLSLSCLRRKNFSLILSQLLRLLKSGDIKSTDHVGFWLGDVLEDLMPQFQGLLHADTLTTYYADIEQIVVEAKASDLVSIGTWKQLTCKQIYRSKISSLNPPKVQIDFGVSYQPIWKRLFNPVLSPQVRDTMYLLLHNKLPVKERLFRIGLESDPYCLSCSNACIQDLVHYFTECITVADVWADLKGTLVNLISPSSGDILTNWNLLNMFFPKNASETECIWLIGNYVSYVWDELRIKNLAVIKKESIFGFLRYKYKYDQLGARMPLRLLPSRLLD